MPRRPATRRWCSPSTSPCTAGASATCGAASSCRRRSASTRCSTAPSTRDGRGASCAVSRSGSPTSPASDVGDGSTAVSLADYIAQPDGSRPHLARRRVVALDLGRPRHHQGHPDGGRRPHRGRRGHRRHRALEPRRSPARLRARHHRPRRARRRRGRRPHRDHLRRRGAARQRHREGRRPRCPRVHGRARLPLRARARPGSAASTTCCRCSTPTCAGPWRSSAPTTSPR